MEGFSFEEMNGLLSYIGSEKCKRDISYLDFSVDTRFCDIWRINFVLGDGLSTYLRTETGYDFASAVYKWLDGGDEGVNCNEKVDTTNKHYGKGLGYDEMYNLLEALEKDHSWKNMYSRGCDKVLIKYIRMQVDVRKKEAFNVHFYNTASATREMSFKSDKDVDLKLRIYNWLNNSRK